MGLFVILLILFLVTKKDKRNSDIFKTILGLGIAVSVISSVTGLSSIPAILFFILLFAALRRRGTADEKKQARENSKWQEQQMRQEQARRTEQAHREERDRVRNEQTRQRERGSSGGSVRSLILPRAVNKRTKIVQNFNRHFTLSLTESEIKRIVDASYLSEAWKREVESMTEKYETVYEWFIGTTNWLRVYIYVFQIQNISSDFARQEQICIETLDEVMRYAESLQFSTMDERISRVNDRFFTCFDETSFMIAYRYMQSKGKKYNLDQIDIVQNEGEIERMARKYQSTN